jgi:hypothetical protein
MTLFVEIVNNLKGNETNIFMRFLEKNFLNGDICVPSINISDVVFTSLTINAIYHFLRFHRLNKIFGICT